MSSEKPLLGLSLTGLDRAGASLTEVARRAERLGYDSVWAGEAWGTDAFTPLAHVAAVTSRLRIGTAIAQTAARTPAATAMTALTLQRMSGGRFTLGIGVSGPQVVEGWHGVPFRAPVEMTREYLKILRKALAGEERLEFSGAFFEIPYSGGQGRPLRTTVPREGHTPILVAAMGPRNVEMAIEEADGLLPYLWSPTRWRDVWGEALRKAPEGFQVAPTVFACVGDDIAACRDRVRPRIALHVGGMGSRSRNFYASLVARYGYADEVRRIQDLFLGGERAKATAAVPDELVDDLALVGPPAGIADRLALWRESPVTTMIVEPAEPSMMEAIARVW